MDIYSSVASLLVGLVAVGIAVQALGLVSLLSFRFRKNPPSHFQMPLPGVTIIKPCFSNQDNEEENFETFFNQDYPGPVQLLFVVSRDSDPIVPLIRKFLARYPLKDAKLVISQTRKAYWLKVDAMYDAHRQVKHELVIWSDSDAIVKRDYVSQMVRCLQEPGVSLVTTPQYDIRVNNFATALKALGNNCDVGVHCNILDFFSKNPTIAWGHSIGFKISEFKSFEKEAWETLTSSFADDLVLPSLFAKHGKKIVFRNVYCPVQYSNKTLRQMFSQQERFALCQKAYLGKWVFMSGLFLFPQISATAFLLWSSFSTTACLLWVAAAVSRIFMSFWIEGLLFGSFRMTLKYGWTIPLWDLLHLYFYFYALFHNQVEYHGKHYAFAGRYLLKEIHPNPIQSDRGTEWAQQGTDPASAQFPS